MDALQEAILVPFSPNQPMQKRNLMHLKPMRLQSRRLLCQQHCNQ